MKSKIVTTLCSTMWHILNEMKINRLIDRDKRMEENEKNADEPGLLNGNFVFLLGKFKFQMIMFTMKKPKTGKTKMTTIHPVFSGTIRYSGLISYLRTVLEY